MKTISVKVYTIDELNNKAKQKVIEREIQRRNENYSFDDDRDYFDEKWKEIGIEETDYECDDYKGIFKLIKASFNKEILSNTLKLNDRQKKLLNEYVCYVSRGNVETESYTYNDNTTDMTGKFHQYDEQLDQRIIDEIEGIVEQIEDLIDDKEKECLEVLKDIIDDLNSEEIAIESIKDCDRYFYENGNIANI